MSDSERQTSSADLASDPDYQALGDAGNPFSGDDKAPSSDTGQAGSRGRIRGMVESAGIDHNPPEHASDDSAENPPLPDWGPTDGEHGVDGSDPTQ